MIATSDGGQSIGDGCRPRHNTAQVQRIARATHRITRDTSITARDVRYLTFLVLGLGVLLRVVYLDADSHYYESIGYITDEGRWVHHARNMFLFGSSPRDGLYDLHFILAPLFELTNYFIFELIGFSLFASRIWTALCGSALLLLFWRGLRQTVTPQALLVGATLLAVQVDFVALSRLAVPEMVAVFFQGLAYFALVSPQRSPRKMFLPGLFLLVAIGMKGTVAPVAAIFSAMILFMPPVDGEPIQSTRRWRDVLWFWAGLITPALLAGSIWMGCCLRESPMTFWQSSGGAGFLSTLIGFVRFSTLYRILAFPFANALAPSVNFLGLGLWLSWLGWMASQHHHVDSRSRRYLITSAVWIVAYLSVSLALEYFPQRYKAHVMLPIAINITVGISLLQQVGMQNVLVSLQRTGRVQWLRLSLLALPAAVFLAPVLAYGIGLTGIDPRPLRIQLACVIISAGTAAYVAYRVKASGQALAFFIVFPLIEAALWLTLSLPGLTHAAAWPTEHREVSILLLLGSLATAVVATSVAVLGDRWRVMAVGALVSVYMIGHVTASLIRLAPTYLAPHYTIKGISRDLGLSLSGMQGIVTSRGEGLFNDNSLRYDRFKEELVRLKEPEIVVSVFEMPPQNRTTLEQQYHLIKTYTPYVSADYFAAHPSDRPPEVRVYKRNDE